MSAYFVDFLERENARLSEVIRIRSLHNRDDQALSLLERQFLLMANEIYNWKQDFLSDGLVIAKPACSETLPSEVFQRPSESMGK